MRIKLKTGVCVELPDDRQVMACNDDLLLVPYAPKSIKKGTILPIVRTLSLTTLFDSVQISPLVEVPLNYAFGYVVGHYLGDGGSYDGALNETRFRSSESSHLHVIAHYLEQVDFVAAPIRIRGVLHGYRVRNAAIYNWFRENFDVLSHTKRMPEWIFSTPHDFRVGSLDGLLSTDGAVGGTSGRNRDDFNVNIGLVNPGLIDGIAVLCRTLGILYSTQTYKIGKRLTISRESYSKLKISHPRKAEILLAATNQPNATRGYNYVVPWNERIRQRLRRYGLRKESEPGLSVSYVKKGYISLVKARQMVEKHQLRSCPDLLVQRWVNWVESQDIVWVRVTAVNRAKNKIATNDVAVPLSGVTVDPFSGVITIGMRGGYASVA
jgi:hypothetical protein